MGKYLVLGAEAQRGSGIKNTSYPESQEGGAQLKIWKLDENLYKEHLDPHSSPPCPFGQGIPSPYFQRSRFVS